MHVYVSQCVCMCLVMSLVCHLSLSGVGVGGESASDVANLLMLLTSILKRICITNNKEEEEHLTLRPYPV